MYYTDYLEHYGVLGMKWGVRKDPDRAYERASKKLKKLDTQLTSRRTRQSRIEYRFNKKNNRLSRKVARARTENQQIKAFKRYRRAIRPLENKKYRAIRRADKTLKKAERWAKEMESTFKNVELSNVDPEISELGRRYLQMSFEQKRR